MPSLSGNGGLAIVERPRLLAILDSGVRLVMVKAPAGYGKSVLLGQYEAHCGVEKPAPLRLNLTPRTATREGLQVSLAHVLGQPADESFHGLLQALEMRGACTILIDNAELLRSNPDAGSWILETLAETSALRLVIAGRGEFGMALARHRAMGELIEVGPEQLRFDPAELTQFLSNNAMPTDGRKVDELVQSVLGWPLGCSLRVQASRRQFEADASLAMSGAWKIVASYFEEEIFAALSPELREFLEDVSVLEVLDVRACDALRGAADSAGLLDEAYCLGAPLWPVDPQHQTYEMLPLFADVLQAGLAQDKAADLQRRAVDILENLGRYRAAAGQALTNGDHARAAPLLERHYVGNLGARGDARFMMLAEKLDPNVRDQHLLILLGMAQILVFNYKCDRARHHLDQARRLLDQQAQHPTPDHGLDAQTLKILLLHREMLLALGLHDMKATQSCCDQLLQHIDYVPPLLRVSILHSLLQAQLELFIFRGADRFYAQAKNEVVSLDDWAASIPLETYYARYLFQTGRSGAGTELLETVLSRLVAESGPKPILGAIAAIALSEMKLESGEYEEAQHLVDDYLGTTERFGFVSVTIAARIVKCRLHMIARNFEAGFDALDQASSVTGVLYDRLGQALAVERIYWLLRLGREREAKSACSAIGMTLARLPEPTTRAGPAEEAFAFTWVQLARSNARLDDAIEVARKWQRYTNGVGAVFCDVRWNVQLATLLTLAGEKAESTRALRRALTTGSTGQYRQTFVMELDTIGEQLGLLLESEISEAEAAFISSILQDAEAKSRRRDSGNASMQMVGLLSIRETSIVNLVAHGMLNREIGEALGMTEGTVKWYLHKIYGKLGIRRRSQIAVQLANWSSSSSVSDTSEFELDD
jgi:LuxR family maltose regulon positive regulatory protein